MEHIINRILREYLGIPVEDDDWYKVSTIAVDRIYVTVLDAYTVNEMEVVHILSCNPDGTDIQHLSTTYIN